MISVTTFLAQCTKGCISKALISRGFPVNGLILLFFSSGEVEMICVKGKAVAEKGTDAVDLGFSVPQNIVPAAVYPLSERAGGQQFIESFRWTDIRSLSIAMRDLSTTAAMTNPIIGMMNLGTGKKRMISTRPAFGTIQIGRCGDASYAHPGL